MFGYLLALCLATLCVFLAFSVLTGPKQRAGRRPRDRPPVQPDQPSADAPTPDRSATATAAEKDAARRKTPPA